MTPPRVPSLRGQATVACNRDIFSLKGTLVVLLPKCEIRPLTRAEGVRTLAGWIA